jgi:hypothetical protein
VLLERLEGVDAITGEFLLRKRNRPGDRLAGNGAFLRVIAFAVLYVDDLMLRPDLLELAQDAAVITGITVSVVLPLPRDNRGEVGRMLGGHTPLIAGIIRNAEHADFAIAPRLRTRPLDALVKIFRFAW